MLGFPLYYSEGLRLLVPTFGLLLDNRASDGLGTSLSSLCCMHRMLRVEKTTLSMFALE